MAYQGPLGHSICPHCKVGKWRQSAGIEFHSIGTLIRRLASDEREFQRLLDISSFTARFNTFATSYGTEPTWKEQLSWLANDAAVSVNFQATPRYNQTALLASPSFDSCLRIMERIHDELRVEGSIYELIKWACGDMSRPYHRGKLKTSNPCDNCGFNHAGDFTKWESVDDIHILPDMTSQEIEIRFAAMRTFAERGFVAMVNEHWYAQDYLAEIGRQDWKMLMMPGGIRIGYKFHKQKTQITDVERVTFDSKGMIRRYVVENTYNYNWFLGIPPGRIVLLKREAREENVIIILRDHVSKAGVPMVLDTMANEDGIYHYFESPAF